MRAWLLLVICGCNAQLSNGPNVTPDADTGGDDIDAPDVVEPDAPPDAPPIALGPWSTPAPVPNAALGVQEDDASLAWNTNEMVFARLDGTNKHLYYMKRTDALSPFDTPVPLPFSADANSLDQTPRFSADDLTLYFSSNRPPSLGEDIWMMTRPSLTGAWTAPTQVLTASSELNDKWYTPCDAGYMVIRDSDIYEGVGTGTAIRVDNLSTLNSETGTYISKNCRTLMWASTRDNNQNDLWTSTRTAASQPWGTPIQMIEFNTPVNQEQDPWMSADGRIFLFASNAGGNNDNDIYMSTRDPL